MEVKLLKYSILVAAIVFAACNSQEGNGKAKKGDKGTEAANLAKGEKLAKSYCGSCHLYVEPSVLDKSTWAFGVLPNMAPRLGIFEHNGQPYASDKGKPNTENVYPAQPAMSSEEWQLIIDYYVAKAPEKMEPQPLKEQYKPDLDLFDVKPLSSNSVSPIITMVKIDKGGGYFVYDANSKGLAKMDVNGTILNFAQIENPISSIEHYKGGYLFTAIGSIFPSDLWKGEIRHMGLSGKDFVSKKLIRSEVERPVQVKVGDLNGDGEKDIVVCGYGNNKGDFYWLDGKDNSKKSIKAISGAINTQLVDYDKDGDLDIFTLFAQGTEQIIYFENDGKGNFKEKIIKQYIPVQGSTSINIIDMNKDGILDILYTCGDNADYSVVFKKFHGVYIYLGDGKGAFNQSYFYPMNGAFKAVPADFDGDGDLDIAAISFFADYVVQPYEGFLYFEQKEDFKFNVKTHPGAFKGRWLTMDVGDIDNDGDEDIVLGNFSQGPTIAPPQIQQTWTDGPAAMLFLNRSGSLK